MSALLLLFLSHTCSDHQPLSLSFIRGVDLELLKWPVAFILRLKKGWACSKWIFNQNQKIKLQWSKARLLLFTFARSFGYQNLLKPWLRSTVCFLYYYYYYFFFFFFFLFFFFNHNSKQILTLTKSKFQPPLHRLKRFESISRLSLNK